MGRTTDRQAGKADSATSGRQAPPTAEAETAWERFRQSRSASRRNALVERYMPLVRTISSRIATELPNSVQVDDLVSAGTFGLMDAIERYDPDLGTRFETYCAVRIRGAILDELRHVNWLPRLQSARATRVDAAADALKGELGRAPSPREIARRTGLKVRDVNNASNNGGKRVSLNSGPRSSDGQEEMRAIDIIEAQGICDPADLLQEKERRDILAREVRSLPRAERLLVMLYYFDEFTMKQIGEALNVSESRICQMHAGILERLQQRLAELDESRSRPD